MCPLFFSVSPGPRAFIFLKNHLMQVYHEQGQSPVGVWDREQTCTWPEAAIFLPAHSPFVFKTAVVRQMLSVHKTVPTLNGWS